MPLPELPLDTYYNLLSVLISIALTAIMINFQKAIKDYFHQYFDAQPQGNRQPETEPVVEKSELDLLRDAKERLEEEYRNLHQECLKEESNRIEAEKKMYPLQELSKHISVIEGQCHSESMKAFNSIEAKYKEDLNKYDKEGDRLYKELNDYRLKEYRAYDCEYEQKHKAHQEACDRYIAMSKLMRKEQKEADEELLKQYPYKMLLQVLTTANRDFEWRRREISEGVMEEYKEAKDELLLKIGVINVKIDRLKNPKPEAEVESPFQTGEDMHNFTESLTYEDDGPDYTWT
jgi:hypothetical protein